jgi:hypothetical protein
MPAGRPQDDSSSRIQGEVIEMEWTPELVKAEIERRHAAAKHSALIRQLRETGWLPQPWWRRLRTHRRLDRDQNEPARRAA